jgi:hypothetical protein
MNEQFAHNVATYTRSEHFVPVLLQYVPHETIAIICAKVNWREAADGFPGLTAAPRESHASAGSAYCPEACRDCAAKTGAFTRDVMDALKRRLGTLQLASFEEEIEAICERYDPPSQGKGGS